MAIIAAIDRTEKAQSVIREAEALAKAFTDTVHVVHVLTISEFVNLGRTAAESGDSVSKDEVIAIAQDIAAEHANDVECQSEAVGLMGSPADQIVKYADEQDARYIVIGPRRRSPAGKVVFGSVSQSILLNADTPVLSTLPNRS